MLYRILPYMRCPQCSGSPLEHRDSAICCSLCGRSYPLCVGILDLIGHDSADVITPFQRIMQMPLIVSIYERLWRRAGYYLASSQSFDREISSVLRLLRINGNDSRILDLACGPGTFTRPLARRSTGIVVGLDLSWPMLRHAQREVRAEGLQNILLVRGSASRLPFLPDTFACVNCCGALHLFDKPDEALTEIERVLCAEGQLCVQTTIRPPQSAGFAYLLEHFIHFGFFEETELRGKIRARGFDILESERHRISFTFLAQCRRQIFPGTAA